MHLRLHKVSFHSTHDLSNKKVLISFSKDGIVYGASTPRQIKQNFINLFGQSIYLPIVLSPLQISVKEEVNDSKLPPLTFHNFFLYLDELIKSNGMTVNFELLHERYVLNLSIKYRGDNITETVSESSLERDLEEDENRAQIECQQLTPKYHLKHQIERNISQNIRQDKKLHFFRRKIQKKEDSFKLKEVKIIQRTPPSISKTSLNSTFSQKTQKKRISSKKKKQIQKSKKQSQNKKIKRIFERINQKFILVCMFVTLIISMVDFVQH